MNTLSVEFQVNLLDEVFDFPRYHGPLFHRWLPDGTRDIIDLDTDNAYSKLTVWFDQMGKKERDLLVYDPTKNEVTDEDIDKQGVLDAGPLKGKLTLSDLIQPEIDILKQNKIDDDIYIKLGKKIVNNLFYPPISNFINILKYNYGQYWIKELEKWDSRIRDLGSYCKKMNMKYSLDSEKTWLDFIPTTKKLQYEFVIEMGGPYTEYMTKEEWNILKTYNKKYKPNLSLVLLRKSQELIENNDMKYALIDAVTSFELCLRDFLSKKINGFSKSEEYLNTMLRENDNRFKLSTITAFFDEIDISTLEDCIKVVDYRNDLVHGGKNPPADAEEKIRQLYKLISYISDGPVVKFPKRNAGNARMNEENWIKEYDKK